MKKAETIKKAMEKIEDLTTVPIYYRDNIEECLEVIWEEAQAELKQKIWKVLE